MTNIKIYIFKASVVIVRKYNPCLTKQLNKSKSPPQITTYIFSPTSGKNMKFTKFVQHANDHNNWKGLCNRLSYGSLSMNWRKNLVISKTSKKSLGVYNSEIPCTISQSELRLGAWGSQLTTYEVSSDSDQWFGRYKTECKGKSEFQIWPC